MVSAAGVLLGGLVFAQGADPIGVVTSKAAELLGGVAVMGAWSAGVTGFLRHHYLKALDGVAVTAVAFIVAFLTTGGLVLVLHAASWTIFVIVAFSLASAIFASGTLAVTIKGPLGAVIKFVYPLLLKYLKGQGIDTSGADTPDAGAPKSDGEGNASASNATPADAGSLPR